MNTVLIGLGLGVAAAIVDIVPMMMQRLPWAATVSAFVHWVVMGVVIAACDLGIPRWVSGMALGLGSAIPIVLVTIGNPAMTKPGDEVKTTVSILAMSLALGGIIGFVSPLMTK